MKVLDDVFASLQQMTLAQLLFGFLACTCYATLQGSLFAGRVRTVASGVAVLAACGFVLVSDVWVDGFMLLAFAVSGLGLFAATLWLLGHLLGFNGRRAPRASDSGFEDSMPARPTPVAAGRPSPPRAAHSH